MTLRALPPDVAELAKAGRGGFTLAAAVAAGISADRIRRLAGRGLLVSIGNSSFACSATLANSKPWQAHAIRSRGFAAGRGPEVFLSGWSAVALRGQPTLGRPPTLPTAIRLNRLEQGTQRTKYGVVRPMAVPPRHQVTECGCRMVSSTWTAVDLARVAPRPNALVLADADLRDTRATRRDMEEVLASMRHWGGRDRAAWIVQHADARAESPLETLGRLSCLEHDLPMPLSNVWVGDGMPMFRVDHLWPYHWVAAEADGALKYRNAVDPAAVVTDQEDREWALRRIDLEVVRYDWRLVWPDRSPLATRFRAVLADHPPRPEPIQWWETPGS